MKFKMLLISLFFTGSILSQSDVFYFKDASNDLTYEDILEKNFTLLTSQVLEKYADQTYWFKVPSHDTDSKYIFKIIYDRINQAEVYQNFKRIDKLPNERYLSYSFLRNHDTYIKVKSRFNAYIPIEFDTEEILTSRDKEQLIFNGFYYGFALLIIIYNLCYYFVFKDDTFFHYSMLLFNITLAVFTMDGMLNFFNINESAITMVIVLNYIFLAFFSYKFAYNYLLLDIHYPKIKTISYALIFSLIIFGILFIVDENFYYILTVNILLFSLLFIFWFSSILLFHKNVYTKILTFAYVIFLFSAIDFYILKFLGISFIDINSTNIKIGAFLEMIILSVAVLYRMNTLKEENIYMRNEIIRFSTETISRTSPRDKIETLSSREREIFNLLALLKTNKEIANELNVSINTVKFHIKNIYEKLEIKSRKEVYTIAENTTK